MNTGLPHKHWDDALQKRQGGILQSLPWADFQQRYGRTAVWDEGDGWQWTATLRESKGLRYLLSSYGPVADNEHAFAAAIESLRRAGRELNTDFVRIEPQFGSTSAALIKMGAKQITELDPQYTAVLDLTQSIEKLHANISPSRRNLVNGTSRRGIKIRQTIDPKSPDLQLFLRMLHETANRAGVKFYQDAYYRNLFQTLASTHNAVLYIAECKGEPVAGAMFFDWGGTRYYAHAAAFQDLNRKLQASTSLVWQGIIDAQKAGATRFDLYGVAPEEETKHHLFSLTRFKRSFGSEQIDYLGTWDIPLKPAKYAAYSMYRKLRGMG